MSAVRQVLGYFKVSSSAGFDRIIVVSQEIVADEENVILSARKVFTLDTADGGEVHRRGGDRVFIGKDGMKFRVTGQCHMHLIDLASPRSRTR